MLYEEDMMQAHVDTKQTDPSDGRMIMFSSTCHPMFPLNVGFDKQERVLVLLCSFCNAKICEIKVASQPITEIDVFVN